MMPVTGLNATDGFAPDLDSWPHKSTPDWIDDPFARPTDQRL